MAAFRIRARRLSGLWTGTVDLRKLVEINVMILVKLTSPRSIPFPKAYYPRIITRFATC